MLEGNKHGTYLSTTMSFKMLIDYLKSIFTFSSRNYLAVPLFGLLLGNICFGQQE